MDAEALFHGDGVGRGWGAWHSGRVRRATVYSDCARAVREAYMNPLISPSLPTLLAVHSSCTAGSRQRTSQLFPIISTRSRWPLLPSNRIPTS